MNSNCDFDQIFDYFQNLSLDSSYTIAALRERTFEGAEWITFYLKHKQEGYIYRQNVIRGKFRELFNQIGARTDNVSASFPIEYLSLEGVKINQSPESYFELYALPNMLKKFNSQVVRIPPDYYIISDLKSIEIALNKLKTYGRLFIKKKPKEILETIDISQKFYNAEHHVIIALTILHSGGFGRDSIKIQKCFPHRVERLQLKKIILLKNKLEHTRGLF